MLFQNLSFLGKDESQRKWSKFFEFSDLWSNPTKERKNILAERSIRGVILRTIFTPYFRNLCCKSWPLPPLPNYAELFLFSCMTYITSSLPISSHQQSPDPRKGWQYNDHANHVIEACKVLALDSCPVDSVVLGLCPEKKIILLRPETTASFNESWSFVINTGTYSILER